MVKITGSQRIDLLGIKKADLPKVWADLGMPSGQAYTKGVRMVKTCVGTEFCRFGTQDSTSAGIEMERRFEQLYTPHKVKMAAVGCPRNCAEATVKDIGLIGVEGGWQVVVGGAAGKSVRKADLLTTVETTGAGARGGGAVLPVLPRERQLPGAHLRLRRAPRHREGAQGDRVRARRGAGRRCSIGCASRRRARTTRGSKGGRRGIRRSSFRSRRWRRCSHERAPLDSRDARCDNIPPREGRAVQIGDREIAIFNLGDRFLATDNRCPHKGGPLCDGIVTGASVVCPLHAWKINLEPTDGASVRPASASAACETYPVRVEDGVIVRGAAVQARARKEQVA